MGKKTTYATNVRLGEQSSLFKGKHSCFATKNSTSKFMYDYVIFEFFKNNKVTC